MRPLGDINAMGWLGRYYAEKIRGATDLYRYQFTSQTNHYSDARTHLITASNHWSQYAAQWSTQYVGQVLTRMGLTVVDIAGIQAYVNADIPPEMVATNGSSILMVVGDATALGAGDTAVRNRLEGYGYSVQVVSDDVTSSVDALGRKLVLTASTVASGQVNTKFRDAAVPVINWETFLQDDYRFTDDADTARQNAPSQTSLNITDPGHPLAAGLPAGIRVVATTAGDFSWGEPGGSPTVIARLSDGSNHPCLYAYETNAVTIGGTNKIGESSAGPDYSFLWTNVPTAYLELTAVATDDGGDTGVSAPVSIVVGEPASRVLFVVGDPVLNSSDAGVKTRLESLGLVVMVMDDDLCTTADADGKELVVTSSTVLSGKVGTKYRDVAVPVLNWEHFLQDDYLMTGGAQGVDWGSTEGQVSLVITNQGHPLADGLADGLTTVAGTAFAFPWGHPNPATATIAATLSDGTAAPCLYGYEAGALLIDGATPAPARRVQFFLTNDAFGELNAAGLGLFDSAVAWLMGRGIQAWLQPPTLEDGQLQILWVGSGTLQTATNVPGPWNDIFGAASPFWATTTNPIQFFRVKQP